MNLIPFPRLLFLMPGCVPLGLKDNSQGKSNFTIEEIIQGMMNAKNTMVAADPSCGRFLSATAHFRGNISAKEVDLQIAASQK